MGYWGKLLGSMAGFAVGGPVGALMGAAVGHAADEGIVPQLRQQLRGTMLGQQWRSPLGQARIAAMFGGREQLFTTCVVVIAAKLAKCDGPVRREEIDAFKREFKVAPESVRDVGRLFDQARDSKDSFEDYATELGEAFADNRAVLEEVLAALFEIARADQPVNQRELDLLGRVHRALGLDRYAWQNAQHGRPYAGTHDSRSQSGGGSQAGGRQSGRARASTSEPDPYSMLGVSPTATDDEMRAARRKLIGENHPDRLSARGVPPDMVKRATDKMARINAAWDRIKRERNL